MDRNKDQICLNAVNEAMDVIGSKWSFFVIAEPYYEPLRFNQLRRKLGTVSIKSLTLVLRHLEQHRIVNRQVFPSNPVSVQYSLTEKGKEYREVLLHMRQWGERWLPERT